MIAHTPIHYVFSRKWRFTLQEDVRFTLDGSFPLVFSPLTFSDKEGHEWCRIEGRILEVANGYSWNGCSPRPLGKWGIWWLGTPDVPATIQASLPHDVCYQMMDQKGFPYSRSQIDKIFLQVMQLHRWPLARVYWAAVRACGGIQHKLTS